MAKSPHWQQTTSQGNIQFILFLFFLLFGVFQELTGSFKVTAFNILSRM